MFSEPTDAEKQTVIAAIETYDTPFVPTRELMETLAEQGVEFDKAVIAINELVVDGDVEPLIVPADNDHDLPAGQFLYFPGNKENGG